jgi:hypothetical protein
VAKNSVDTAGRTREILAKRGLTLYKVSQLSAEIFGPSAPHYIPRNFYYELSISRTGPSIQQMVALSRISNYRLVDWLAVFSIHLDDIPRLSALVPRPRTIELDSSIYDENAWTNWFVGRKLGVPIPPIAPLGVILAIGTPKRAKELPRLDHNKFLYARVGQDDRFASPDVLPGGIVRVDKEAAKDCSRVMPNKQVFLVEQDSRLICCRLQRVKSGHLILFSRQYPFDQPQLLLGREAQVRGVVDTEVRPLLVHPGAEKPRKIDWPGQFQVRQTSNSPQSLLELLPASRFRTGLSFREASRISRWIAKIFGDELYFTATSSLSDYEAVLSPPRHLQKIITLCILYSIRFWDFLHASGIHGQQIAGESIPDELVPRPNFRAPRAEVDLAEGVSTVHLGFLQDLMSKWEAVPSFLWDAVKGVTGQKSLSLSDIFWVGGDQHPLHPGLTNATFIAVNRRSRKPPRLTARCLLAQALYLLLKRDGEYICGCCTLQRDVLSIHPFSDRPIGPRQLINNVDAEVVGQVTTVIKHL